MTTRTIVTSQPDVSCDVCERRLLRGEQPDVFLAAGRRRTVCELCAPRAAHEGWMRESDSLSLKLAPMRTRRGRSLLDRLRQVGKPTDAATQGLTIEPDPYAEPEPYDFLDGYEPAASDATPTHGQIEPASGLLDEHGLDPQAGLVADQQDGFAYTDAHLHGAYVAPAIEVFNASEFPRRLAGVARSLGAPTINVSPAEHLSSVVRIMVAWELCWYRYEVDLSEPEADTRIIAQGTELDELAREERIGNALASESGTLTLA
jgi:hypothetical protein